MVLGSRLRIRYATGMNNLTWDDTYGIVMALETAWPQVDVEQIGLDELCRIVVNLPDFVDDPALANEGILKDLLREWYEERVS